jgi:hypothetical protein
MRYEMSIEIRLNGDAAAQAQTLVADLLAAGIDVHSIPGEDQDRALETLLTDFSVALVAEATYGTVRDLVGQWRTKRNQKESEVVVTATDQKEVADAEETDESSDHAADTDAPS